MDNTLKKSDLSKRILETRRQTEELKAQLQNLIDSGINSSLEYKATSHSHLDKENIKESQNKVQIIKSYDTAHSQHIAKPSSSRINLPESQNTKIENQDKNSKKVRHYDVNKAREYMKKQKEKRSEQQKLQNEEKKKAELQKQKLKELQKKSLELVSKNIQAKRERSKSRERIDFIRPVKDIPRSRSTSREKGDADNKPVSKINYDKRGKSVERIKNVPKHVEYRNPNLLYPPVPNYELQTREQKTKISKKKSPSVSNKIVILSGNSSDKKVESPTSDKKNKTESLRPINLFNTPKNTNILYSPSQDYEQKTKRHINTANRNEKVDVLNKNLLNKNTNTLCPSSHSGKSKIPMHVNTSNKIEEKTDVLNKDSSHSFNKISNGNANDAKNSVYSKILDLNVDLERKLLKAADHEVNPLVEDKSLENGSNKKFVSVSNILEYKNVQSTDKSNINLRSPENFKLISNNNNNIEKPMSEVAIGTDNLEKLTKETQTNNEPKHKFPPWLQDGYDSNPLNFINTVKRKLQYAINSPTSVDVGIQSSFAQQNMKPESSLNPKSKEEIMEILQQSTKSSKKSDLKSFMSHKCINLDPKTIDNIELIPKSFNKGNLMASSPAETESESDTSKNIPEISSESGTSLKKNAESVKQNDRIGLDAERLSSLKLKAHSVNKNTHSIQSEEIQTEATSHPYSAAINNKPTLTKTDDVADSKTEIRSNSKILHKNDQYTSDFLSGSHSTSTLNSSPQNKTSMNSPKNTDYQIMTDPQITQYSEKHSSNIPNTSEKHSKTTTPNISTNSANKKHSCRNITIRTNSLGRNTSQNTSIQNTESRNQNTIKENTISEADTSKYNKISSNISTVMKTQESKNEFEESQKSELKTSVESSKKPDKYGSLYSNSHRSATVTEVLSKSDSNLQYVNTRRGSQTSSDNSKFMSIHPLKEPTLSLVVANGKVKRKLDRKEDRNKLLKNISIRSDTNKFTDLNNTNEIHLKFEAEIHLLNDFNESLRQFSEVEKAFNSLKSKNVITETANKVLQNQDTQTSVVTQSSTTSKPTENSVSEGKSELSTINFSRGFLVDADSSNLNVDTTVSKLDDTNNAEDFLSLNANNDLSNFENLHSHNFAGMTLRMFEQLIKDEDVRLENLKTILKIREQALLDRTKGELAWLEIQRKHLRETGKLHEASLIKKKQRGILVNHQKERHEMQRLKQMQKAASIERKIILKEQRNLIKHQLSTDKMLSKIKVNAPRERRLSGPLKVIQSHTESIRSETSFSRRSSSDKERETYNVMSHTQSIVSIVSEVSGEEVIRRDETPGAESTDLAIKLPNEACGVPISQMKRTLLIREAALQKRRKAAEELLQWHRKLLEEEKRITELESTANTIISQIPNNVPTSPDVIEKYQFRGKQLNQLWFNLTGCEEKKFSENKIYPMSQISLERFCKSAREYSTKTKASKQSSGSEISEFSGNRTDDSISENIPARKVILSASIRTESGELQQSSYQHESVPVTTVNDYTSDFDIESIQDIVNVEGMNVLDQSINQLIDNFNKIQDDISSLSIKQSIKSDVDLERDDSIRSERTDSDVEVSVIETAKTSKEKSLEETDLDLIENKINNSNKTLSVSEDITSIDKSYNESVKSDVKTSSKINEEISKSKSTDDKIDTEMPDRAALSEAPSEENNLNELIDNDNKTNSRSTYDKTPSIREENALNIEGINNLNKSQEILEELCCLESQIIEDIPSKKEFTVEDIQITDKGKDNLSRSEEILLKLSQSEDKHSIIAFTDTFKKDSLRSESKISLDKNSGTESEGVLLELRPINDKTSVDVSSVSASSKEETNQLHSEDGNSVSINTSKDILLIERSPEVDLAPENIRCECEEDIILNGETVSHNSEIISEKPFEFEESSKANEISVKISEEAIINNTTHEISELSNKVPSFVEENSEISEETENDEYVANEHKDDSENKSRSISIDSIPPIKDTNSEEVTDSLHEDQDEISVMSEKDQSVPIQDISEIIESFKETDVDERLSTDKTKSDNSEKSLSEQEIEMKDRCYGDTLPSVMKAGDNEEIDVQEKLTEEFSLHNKNAEPVITTEESGNEIKENSVSNLSETNVSEKIPLEKSFAEPSNSEKPTLEEESVKVASQQTTDVVPSITEEIEKSQMTSIAENLATLLSKEDINSYEEKELDSLSSSTTGSQSSILNEKEENQVSEKSKSVEAEEKSPRSGAVDVKKRVSEIMADANQVSRGDKSPKLQDFYTTTYDLVSPANSPELGSPTEEQKYMTAKSIFGTEAEEILRKQLAIEQEIKQITEQQQKEQLPYLYVREIPNKPPPPYTPPSSLPVANVISIIPTSEEIESITKYSAKILHKAYASDNLDNISISENTLSLICKNINKECYKFVFDLCKEISREHYKQFEKEECPTWLQVRKNSRLAVIKPLDVTGLEKHMNKKLKELFEYEKPIRRENTIIKWSRKKRDHVDEILVMESQAEETQWTNYDKDELLVMNEVTNEIMNMLLKETGEVFSKILSKQTF